jgi:copper chaperone CopZ
MILAVVASVGAAAFTEEESIPVKVYVKGMSCPAGCGSRVTQALKGVEGARSVKLTNFDEGLFTVEFDLKTAIKPSELKKAVGTFEIARVEAALEGTVSSQKEGLMLRTSGGTSYRLAEVEECCLDAKAAKTAAPNKDDDCDCCRMSPLAKVHAWLKANKDGVRVTGLVSECCGGALTLAVKSAELKSPK